MISFTFSRTVASSFAFSVERRICSSSGLRGFWLGGDLKVTLLALKCEFRLKGSFGGVIFGLAFGDLLGFSNVSAPIAGLVLVLAEFGAERPFHVFRAAGGSLGVSFGEVWATCLGLGVLPRLGVRFLTGEWGILLVWRLLRVLVGDSLGSLVGLRLRLGESLLSRLTVRSGLARLDLSWSGVARRAP